MNEKESLEDEPPPQTAVGAAGAMIRLPRAGGPRVDLRSLQRFLTAPLVAIASVPLAALVAGGAFLEQAPPSRIGLLLGAAALAGAAAGGAILPARSRRGALLTGLAAASTAGLMFWRLLAVRGATGEAIWLLAWPLLAFAAAGAARLALRLRRR